MDLLSSGIYSVLPWITMAVSANVGGWIADSLVGKGYSVTLVRKLMQTVRHPTWRYLCSLSSALASIADFHELSLPDIC